MIRSTVCAALFICLFAGCATREPSSQELQSKRFQAKPDMAVVYLYRDRLDFSQAPASLTLDERGFGSTYAGTYYRLELAPGRHRVAGFAGDSGAFEFTAEAGRLYFIRHSVSRFMGFDRSFFSRSTRRMAVTRCCSTSTWAITKSP